MKHLLPILLCVALAGCSTPPAGQGVRPPLITRIWQTDCHAASAIGDTGKHTATAIRFAYQSTVSTVTPVTVALDGTTVTITLFKFQNWNPNLPTPGPISISTKPISLK